MKLCIAFGLLLPEGQAGTAWHPSEQKNFPLLIAINLMLLATSPASSLSLSRSLPLSLSLSLSLALKLTDGRSDCPIFTSTCCQHRHTFTAKLRSERYFVSGSFHPKSYVMPVISHTVSLGMTVSQFNLLLILTTYVCCRSRRLPDVTERLDRGPVFTPGPRQTTVNACLHRS